MGQGRGCELLQECRSIGWMFVRVFAYTCGLTTTGSLLPIEWDGLHVGAWVVLNLIITTGLAGGV